MTYKMGSNMGAAYQQDFYTWTPNGFPCSICTIGNPPFGANSKDAIAFFKRAAKMWRMTEAC